MERHLNFSESEIQALFGHEAAENEEPTRLREYYFKNETYDQITADLSLRILVGHKGVGKSALFKVAIAEAQEAGKLTVLIRPDDIIGVGADTSDFLKTIRDWKEGLLSIVCRKVLSAYGADSEGLGDKIKATGGKILDFLHQTFRNIKTISDAPAKQLVLDQFLKTRKVSIYIDDLDRGWQGRREDVLRISALLNAVRDLASDNPGVSFKISLRSDVYYLARTSDESTDKIEGSVIWHAWTNHQIFALLIKRIETFFGKSVNESQLLGHSQAQLATYLDPIVEPRFAGKGHWQNAPMYRVLMSLVRKRPRDLVKLLTLSARQARYRKATRIITEDLTKSFEEYSQGRIQDTINEFRSELPDIERLLINMKPSRKERTAKQGYVYSTETLLKKLDDVMQQGAFMLANGRKADRKDLAAFLYKINFLTARKEQVDGIVRKYFEENRYLSSTFADFGFDWEIHPAYRWALQPDNLDDIYTSLRLNADT